MTALPPLSRAAPALVLMASLTGCAGMYRVDNQVESFARWTDATAPSGAAISAAKAGTVPAAPQSYRFERLPSQASGAEAQSQEALEGWTERALAPLGWTLAQAPAQASWTVQVTAQQSRLPRAPWDDPWDGRRLGGFASVQIGVGNGLVAWNPWMRPPELPYHLRQVSLVIRDSNNGRITYETRARHDGRWNSTPELWQAMLSAALAGFPVPPPGIRRVDLDLPR